MGVLIKFVCHMDDFSSFLFFFSIFSNTSFFFINKKFEGYYDTNLYEN